MGALKDLQKWKTTIDEELSVFFERKIAHAETISLTAKDMLEEMRDICLRGGKRIRPSLMIMGYFAYGGENKKAIITASLAIELMHLALISQDDIMDQDEMRHGGPSLYAAFAKEKNQRYGENMAYCGADMLFALSFEVLEQSDFTPKVKLQAIRKLCQIMFNTGTGQMLDIEQEKESLNHVKEDDIIETHILKTAKYSFEGPLHLGGILAGASDEELFRISEYAIPVGQAFQLRDDMLGLYGTSQQLGKPAQSDIVEGKRTLLMVKTYELGTTEDRDFLLDVLGREVTDEELDKIRNLVKKTGAYTYCDDLAKALVARARRKLEKCALTENSHAFLDGIAQYMAEREY